MTSGAVEASTVPSLSRMLPKSCTTMFTVTPAFLAAHWFASCVTASFRAWSTQIVSVGPAARATWMLPASAARTPATTTTRSAPMRFLELMLDPPVLRQWKPAQARCPSGSSHRCNACVPACNSGGRYASFFGKSRLQTRKVSRTLLASGRETCYTPTEHGESPRGRPASGSQCRDRLARGERQLRCAARDTRAGRTRHARAPVRPLGTAHGDGPHRRARARTREPHLPGPRASDRDAGGPGGPRLDPLQHAGGDLPRGRLRAHAPRPSRRGDDLHLVGDDESPRRSRPLREACGGGRPA